MFICKQLYIIPVENKMIVKYLGQYEHIQRKRNYPN